jgi:replication factor C subunit 2/4
MKNKKYINIKTPFVEKYRPSKLKDILMDSFLKTKFLNIVMSKSIPNLIITGEPGTGKTSTILYIAREVYNNRDLWENNILELNASDDRGLTIINNIILPFCKKKSYKTSHKLIILDEADSITPKAQNLLGNIISEYKKNTRFVFICNNFSKMNESIQSNCMIVRFPNISIKRLKKKVIEICNSESIKYTEKGIDSLLFVSDNDIRFIINNLECIYYTYNELTKESVYKFIDKPKPYYIKKIIKLTLDGKLIESINIVTELYEKGYSPNDILLTFMKFLLEGKYDISEETKLKIYELVSLNYIRVNDGIGTLLQLYGCVSNIYQYMGNKSIEDSSIEL